MPKKTNAAASAQVATKVAAARKTKLRSPRVWKLEDAKAKFSEVVRRARSDGPQRVTYRGVDAVVVVSAAEFERLAHRGKPRQSLVEFLQRTALGELDVRRPVDRGRNIRF